MKFKKPQAIIIVFAILWIIFIGWGIIRTTFRLPKQRPSSAKETASQQAKPALPVKEPSENAKAASLILVRTLKATPINFSDLLPVMGTIKGDIEIELRFEINGIIKSIYFREGAKIKKGSLVACLDSKDAELKLDYAKNKLASMQAAYQANLKKVDIHQKLYQAGVIIKSKLEEVRLESESAKFQVETVRVEKDLAKKELQKTNLYAPIDAVMGPREAEEGEFITPQDPIGSLFKITDVLVEAGIVERDIHKVKLGQKAKVFVDAYPNIAFEGRIDNIFPIVEGRSRTLTVKIRVNNPKTLLLPGMFCRAEIIIVELKDALMVPSTSLIIMKEKTVLLPVIPAESIKIDENEVRTGELLLSRVTTGYITSDYVQITQGLNMDDLVVIEARGELQDKKQVQISAVEEISF